MRNEHVAEPFRSALNAFSPSVPPTHHATILRLEVVRGKPDSAPPLVKQAVRLARRLRNRRIYNVTFPSFVRRGEEVCRIEVGRRIVTLLADGSCHASLIPFKRGSSERYDRHAMLAHTNRMHALYMTMAAEDRRRHWLAAARVTLNLATQERNREI